MKNFDSELLDEIKKRFSTKEDMASTLSEWLSTNKNAIYRRLRGDTLFTFNELCMIASKLEISIDKIVLKENSVIWRLFYLKCKNIFSLAKKHGTRKTRLSINTNIAA